MREVHLKKHSGVIPYLSNKSGDSCKSGNLGPEEWYHSFFYISLRKSGSRLVLESGEYL